MLSSIICTSPTDHYPTILILIRLLSPLWRKEPFLSIRNIELSPTDSFGSIHIDSCWLVLHFPIYSIGQDTAPVDRGHHNKEKPKMRFSTGMMRMVPKAKRACTNAGGRERPSNAEASWNHSTRVLGVNLDRVGHSGGKQLDSAPQMDASLHECTSDPWLESVHSTVYSGPRSYAFPYPSNEGV